jgi:hypothetical protein
VSVPEVQSALQLQHRVLSLHKTLTLAECGHSDAPPAPAFDALIAKPLPEKIPVQGLLTDDEVVRSYFEWCVSADHQRLESSRLV